MMTAHKLNAFFAQPFDKQRLVVKGEQSNNTIYFFFTYCGVDVG